jgi:hypothetical protein
MGIGRAFYTKLGWKQADFIEYNKTKWTDFVVE